MDQGLAKLKQTLKEAGSNATKSRQSVFNELQKNGPISIAALTAATKQQTDRATVYRTVELFEKLGIVNRIWHDTAHQVELSEIFTPHHHHAVCQNCGRIVDITSSELESAISTLAKHHKFLALNHTVELSGYCSNCQS